MTEWEGAPITKAEVRSLVPPEMTAEDIREMVYAMPDEVVAELLRATDGRVQS